MTDQKNKDHKKDKKEEKQSQTPSWIAWVLALIVIVGIVIAIKSFFFAPQEPIDKPLVIVNTERIHQSYVDKKYNELGPELQQIIPYEEFFEQLIEQRLLIQSAKANKIEVEPQAVLDEFDLLLESEAMTRDEFRTHLITRNLTEDDILTTIRNNLLIEGLMQKVASQASEINEEELKELYEINKETFKVNEAVRASHIVVENIETIQEIQALLRDSADFGTLATEFSIDEGTKEFGGDLGFFEFDMMPAEFSSVAFKLKPEQISAPVKTEFGWHLIKVTDHKKDQILSYEEVKPILEQNLLDEKMRLAASEYIDMLKEKATITRENIE